METLTGKELEQVIEVRAQANKSLTNEQFKALERSKEGDILELSQCFFLISDKQRTQLSGDDWSRMDMLEEDMRCMMAECMQ